MAFADDLLEQAEHLVRRERRRPRQASLRRAVSTAYYALFHLLIAETTRNWRRSQDRDKLARMFEHATMRRSCITARDELRKQLQQGLLPLEGVRDAEDLAFLADTFVKMQQQRHSADYDGSVRWTRTDAEATVRSVAAAFARWRRIRQADLGQDFLVSLLLRERR